MEASDDPAAPATSAASDDDTAASGDTAESAPAAASGRSDAPDEPGTATAVGTNDAAGSSTDADATGTSDDSAESGDGAAPGNTAASADAIASADSVEPTAAAASGGTGAPKDADTAATDNTGTPTDTTATETETTAAETAAVAGGASTAEQNAADNSDAAEGGDAASPDDAAPTPGEQTHADTGNFIGHGARIEWRAWLPETDARGVIVLVHGVAEHAGRYEHVGRRLAGAGFAVYALDHPGHGISGGARANIGSMDAAADNVATLLAMARREFPEVPAFLLAHSMGSLIVLFLATREPIEVDGIVVSAPPLDIPVGNPIQRLLAPVLTRLTPNLGVLKLDSADISRDPKVVAAYDSDPLVFRGKLPARTATEILNAALAVKGRLQRLTVPTLAMHGTADTIAAPSSTDLIEKGAGAEDLTVRRYDGLYHEIFNEPEQDQVLGDVVEWLEAHLGK
ncbi:alpha/beta hydrolase [Nocardia cyriacigeorgica]|uniref:alpha/beta hydrolase n=1 Tax=Nocardia cyriacigeorgica TaxID=135487 RepID=UPI002490B26D|nr:alpha/beta hydrolase [Nocardia cyriacigeorgica]